MNAQVAKKTTATEPAEDANDQTEETTDGQRKAPYIRVEHMSKNMAGRNSATWHVRAPEGMIGDDLRSPHIWRRVQDNRNTALKRFDEIRVIGFDGTWAAWAIVASASQEDAILAITKIVKLPAPRETLAQDDTYQVVFDGQGYAVHRKRDGIRMTDSLHSAKAAATALLNLYPRYVP